MELEYPKINYSLLTGAISYYKRNGFKYIDVPWIVPKEITNITFNRDNMFNTKLGDLVGSAEQSFISLMLSNKLEKGTYSALTPCFRNETNITKTNQNYFMKVELIDTKTVTHDRLLQIINVCFDFFKRYISEHDKITVIQTDDGYDIMVNDIEVGSYGIRMYNEYSWIYATGLAEPRFSVSME